MLKVQNADVYTDFNGLGKLKAEAREQDPEALKQVAKQFESLFLNMVLKSMRQAKLDDGAMDNDQSKFYQDMYDQQLAVHLSGESGIGLANMMVKQLSPNQTQSLAQKDIVEYIKNPTQAINPADLSVHDMAKLGLLKRESTELPPVAPMAAPQLEKLMANLPDIPEPEVPGSKKAFVEQLLPLAQKAAQELGVEPKVLIAQAALETRWGRSVIKNRDGSSSYNLFNIKTGRAWEGKQARVSTLEFEDGTPKKVMAGFRAYDSFADSFNDYVKFIKEKPRYADALKEVSNPERYMQELQQAGYATDPQYAGKVMSIYNSRAFAGSTATVALR